MARTSSHEAYSRYFDTEIEAAQFSKWKQIELNMTPDASLFDDIDIPSPIPEYWTEAKKNRVYSVPEIILLLGIKDMNKCVSLYYISVLLQHKLKSIRSIGALRGKYHMMKQSGWMFEGKTKSYYISQFDSVFPNFQLPSHVESHLPYHVTFTHSGKKVYVDLKIKVKELDDRILTISKSYSNMFDSSCLGLFLQATNENMVIVDQSKSIMKHIYMDGERMQYYSLLWESEFSLKSLVNPKEKVIMRTEKVDRWIMRANILHMEIKEAFATLAVLIPYIHKKYKFETLLTPYDLKTSTMGTEYHHLVPQQLLDYAKEMHNIIINSTYEKGLTIQLTPCQHKLYLTLFRDQLFCHELVMQFKNKDPRWVFTLIQFQLFLIPIGTQYVNLLSQNNPGCRVYHTQVVALIRQFPMTPEQKTYLVEKQIQYCFLQPVLEDIP